MKKGFTLFEILAVLIILGLLVVIIVPSMGEVLQRNREKLFYENEGRIVDSAQKYLIENPINMPRKNGETVILDFDTLISEKYLKEITDLENKNFKCDGYVLVTKIADKNYDFLPYLECSNYISGLISKEGLVFDMPLGTMMSGNIFKESVNNFNGVGNNVTSGNNRFNVSGKATSFNGTSSYIETVNNTTLRPSNFSISIWFMMNASANTTVNYVVLSNWEGYSIEIQANTLKPYLNLNGIGIVESTENLVLGKWYNIVGVFKEDDGGKIYINGELRGTLNTENAINYNTNTVLNIGRRNTGIHFHGLIDDIKIYNRSLNYAEISHLYNIESKKDVN